MQTTVLILAGKRADRPDPLAAEFGISHKAMIEIEGEALIGHVLRSVEEAIPGANILISTESWDAISRQPRVAQLHGEGRLDHLPSQANLYESVLLASDQASFPLLITTADNALLTPEAVRAIVEAGKGHDGAIVGLTRREAIEQVHPGGKGRYYEFADGEFSNCNLFWIGSRSAIQGAEAFREGGQFLKVKGRFLATFGLVNLLLYRMKIRTLEQMFVRLSRRMGCTVTPLVFADGRLAIDVDDSRSLQMVKEIMALRPPRERSGPAPGSF